MCADTLPAPLSDAARSDDPDRQRTTAPLTAAEWCAEQAVAPGDSHDKGELSLCVGEAA